MLGLDYLDWSKSNETSNVKASLRRDTTLRATRWSEMEPGPLRVEYKQRADLDASDRRWARLDVDLTIYLDPKQSLPRSREAAVTAQGSAGLPGRGNAQGLAVKGHWGSVGDGDEYVRMEHGEPKSSHSPHSLLGLSTELPKFAGVQLPVKDQEAALLHYLAKLKKRVRPSDATDAEVPVEDGRRADGQSVTEIVKVAGDIVTDAVPGLGNLKELYTFYFGETVLGEKVGWFDRLAALIFAIPGVGNLAKLLKRGAGYVAKHVVKPLIARLTKKLPGWGKKLQQNLVKMRSVKEIDADRQKVLKEIDGELADVREAANDRVSELRRRATRPRDTEELLDGLEAAARRGDKVAAEILKKVENLNEKRKQLREERRRAKRREKDHARRERRREERLREVSGDDRPEY